ncbi:hypothetical protein EUTSA_v10009409mg [Eutrema salsugineum]|uniref:non-specific serine/threonine protein kinase n=1 Tax=Eutrema salsugineum TaxID=72664 RepID=V4K8D2_EUTSA|nr:hypothetical protein EUTSA_v10009409mg [Eutrema salsugineum]
MYVDMVLATMPHSLARFSQIAALWILLFTWSVQYLFFLLIMSLMFLMHPFPSTAGALTGEVQGVKKPPQYTYLTGNMLSGNIDLGDFLNTKSMDFNIKEEANGTLKPLVKEVKAVNVTNHLLEFGCIGREKGQHSSQTEDIYYGPLISALSLCHPEKTKHHTSYRLILGATDLRAQGIQTVCFTWRQLQTAKNNFDQANKLGERRIRIRGELSDGTIIAVKQLSSKSCQGNREFLYGCCVEKNQLLLVYEYMENNSLALALYGKSSQKLDWVTRQKICVGIARGLEFLHEGSMIRMIHRDIKTSNVLLDADLNAKISDFGLARLHEAEHSHIRNHKADVYSFGVVAMEIVSGSFFVYHFSLINWALTLQQKGDIMEIEAVRMINVSLICTNSSPLLRPTMSEVVQMFEGVIEIPQVMSSPDMYGHDLSFSMLMERIENSHTAHGSGTPRNEITASVQTTTTSLVSDITLNPFNLESAVLNPTTEISSSSL